MRSQRVFTHLRCNQACTYCTFRRSADEPREITRAAVRAKIEDAVAGGAEEIVFSGGEPTMRGDLADLVRDARERGAKVVELETNATLVTGELARSLAAAGLSLARVNLAGWTPELDLVTRDQGGFAATVAGMRALRDAGIPLEVAATLVRSTVRFLGELPAGLVAELGGAVSRVVAVVPAESPDEHELLTHEEAARALSLSGNIQARLPLTLKLVHPENEEPEVLQECMQALIELEDPNALEVLEPYLKHSDRRLAAYASLMIAQSQQPGAAALLANAVEQFSGDALKAVVLALSTVRDPDAYDHLHRLLKSEREAVRLAVIDALPPDAASQALLKALAARDISPRVKAAAKAALAS